MGKEYYTTLGINKNASKEEIKKAYKNLAKKYHPDVSSEPDAESKFKEIQEAYSVLSDDQKKSNYDQFGSSFDQFKGFSGFGGFDFGGSAFDFEDIFDTFSGAGSFSDLFGFGRGRRRGPQRGTDIVLRMGIAFEDAVFGTEKEIELERIEQCIECTGTGIGKNSKKKTCPKCQGRGVEFNTRRTFLGTIQTQTTCSYCKGQGTIIEDPCKACSGTGRRKAKKKISFKIPEGVYTGNKIRLGGEGHAGEQRMPAGDLYILLFVEPSDVFKRDGFDLYNEIPLTFSEAALGTAIDIPTVRGKANLNIPQGTQSGTVFRLKKQGVKHLNSERIGDQYVKVILQTPKKLSKNQKELFEQLSESEGTKAKRDTFFDKIKETFKK